MEDGSCSIVDNKWRHRDDTTIIKYYLNVNKLVDFIWQNTIQVFFELWLLTGNLILIIWRHNNVNYVIRSNKLYVDVGHSTLFYAILVPVSWAVLKV